MDFEPKWVAWEITRRCNLSCVHCRSSSKIEVEEHPDFSFDQATKVLDDIVGDICLILCRPIEILEGIDGAPQTFNLVAVQFKCDCLCHVISPFK